MEAGAVSVKSVERAIALLDLFSREKSSLSITEIAARLGMSKSAAHSLAATLVQGRFLQQYPESRKYCLGLKNLELGMIQPDVLGIHQKAAGPARALTRKTEMTCHLALWDGIAIYLTHSSTFPAARPVLFGLLGPRLPAYATGLGKAVLACLSQEDLEDYLASVEMIPQTPSTVAEPSKLKKQLAQARRLGVVMEKEEMVVGAASQAAPFFNESAQVIGAVSLFSTADRITRSAKKKDFVQALLETSYEISSLYGCAPDRMSLTGRGGL
jgi:DNA-binding IclR family transcriptional regulator